MQNIPMALVKPGMVLAKDIMRGGSSGRVPICGKGMVLTDVLIDRLARMGVQSAVVKGHPIQVEGEDSLEEMLLKLERRFMRVGTDPLMTKIKAIYRNRIIRSMGEEDG